MRKLLCAIGVLFLTGCNDRLTHSKAKSIITTKYSFPITEDEVISYGIISSEQDSLPKYYYLLQKAGVFSINFEGERDTDIFGTKKIFKVTLTGEGKRYLNNKIDVRYPKGENTENMVGRFITCTVQFKEVEEVHEMPGLNAAKINFKVERSNFTPFWNYYLDPAKRMPDTIQLRTFAAIKTADGWKAAK